MISSIDIMKAFFNGGSSETLKIAERFMLGGVNEKRYLFGRTEDSAALSKIIDIDGFIDDFCLDNEWLNKPVLRTHDIALDSLIINCVLNARPVSAHRKLKCLGFINVLSLSDLYRHYPTSIRLPKFSVPTESDLLENSQDWIALYNGLADDESRQVLNDVLEFRLTLNYSVMGKYKFRPEEQYFEEFMGYSDEVFVDAGAFDGDTTKGFCVRYPGYRKIYLFEPIAESMAKACANLASFRDIHFINKGVSDSSGKLCFNSTSGSANAVMACGDTYVEVVTIDEQVAEPVTFIKMDLEGWERKALVGAKKQIISAKPKLAIAVYHVIEDFREIFKYVKSLNPEYKVYLRHYTEGWSETIMYFR